jgi:hypothetical protein
MLISEGWEDGFGPFDVSIRSAPTGEARLATACVLLNTRNNLVYDFSVAPPFIAFTVVGMSPCPVRKMIGSPSLFAKRVCNFKPVMSGS